MNGSLVLRSLREAALTMLAAAATMGCALAIDPEPGPAILALVLCLSLGRSRLDRDLRGRLEAAAVLPVVSLAALGVAILLHRAPWLGAAAFVAAISGSIWLRRFGPGGRKAGTLIALPFVVILVTPYVPPTRVGPALALLLPVIVALLALAWTSVLHALGERLGWQARVEAAPSEAAEAPRAGARRPVASTRMALQMAAALALAFGVGHLFFDGHWAWVVLTAFIVGSGNRGRLDVAHKSVLRVAGAAAGTLVALAAGAGLGAHDAATVALMLAAVFLGLWLRPLGYAWWALFVTLALALLQAFVGGSVPGVLGPRLTAIVVGALLGVAAAWFVLPVRSTDVLRRRIADALAALSEAFDPATPRRTAGPFLARLAGVDELAPAFRAARRVSRSSGGARPADWIDALAACRAPAVASIERGETPGAVRKAVGAARKAMREPAAIGPALEELRRVLAGLAS